MGKLVIDENVWGRVEDFHAENDGASRELKCKMRMTGKKPELVSDEGGDIITVALGQEEFSLKVRRAIGGNQHNVWSNLGVLRPEMIGEGEVELHTGLQNGPVRKVIYIHGIGHKTNLVDPAENGPLVFDRDLTDTTVFISSSPHGESGKPYWAGLREALKRHPDMSVIWNPGSIQIAPHGIERETIEALGGRVRMMQVNEEEAEELVRWHLHADGDIARLQDLVGAEWTVVTRGAKGIRVYAGGQTYNEPVITDTHFMHAILKNEYCDGNDVGCGDAVTATFIADMDKYELPVILKTANTIAKLQFHHMGPNLSNIKCMKTSHSSPSS